LADYAPAEMLDKSKYPVGPCRTMNRVDAVRRFNRFYTRRIGALQAHFLGRPFSLPEARVLYELGQRRECTATALGADLGLDLGYLSRLLQGLKRQKMVHGERAQHDARQTKLSLTTKGRNAYLQLDARSREEVAGMLAKLAAHEQARLVDSLRAVEQLLNGKAPARGEITLRAHRPGDIGWVVQRHGALYAEEYGWDERFEALVAGIAKDFVQKHDPSRERCWIAQMDREPVGCVFVVKQNKSTAKLRLLIVEPKARGRGLGRRLVEECVAFARAKGYRKLVLWTQSNLAAARHIYEAAGFKLRKKEPHNRFGIKLVGEYWELVL
jgi:DNA-binding MarR family transcriptional regulator/predicted GNAT family N-acyltransferase